MISDFIAKVFLWILMVGLLSFILGMVLAGFGVIDPIEAQPDNPAVHWPCTRAEAVELMEANIVKHWPGKNKRETAHWIAVQLSNDTFEEEQ